MFFYCRFLSRSIATKAMAIIMAAVDVAKYISNGVEIVSAIGVGNACGAGSTANAVTACDGQ